MKVITDYVCKAQFVIHLKGLAFIQRQSKAMKGVLDKLKKKDH